MDNQSPRLGYRGRYPALAFISFVKFNLKILLCFVALIAFIPVLVERTPITIRENLGDVGAVSMGVIAPGDRINVYGETAEGNEELISGNLIVAKESRLVTENQQFVVIHSAYATFWQRNRIRKYSNYRIELLPGD